MNLDQLAGPAALAIAASAAVVALWRAHVQADAMRDAALRELTQAVAEFPTALHELAAIVTDAARQRKP